MRKTLFTAISATVLLSTSAAFAQVETAEDDRFKPRIYGSTAVTGVIYSEGARAHLENSGQIISEPAVTKAPVITETTRIVEDVPVLEKTRITYRGPVYSEAGVVKAQHIKPGDVSAEDYQLLLDEAARVRAYQGASQVAPIAQSNEVPSANYEIELFEPSAETQIVTETAQATPRTHKVIKGDTLYNISKRYNVGITELQDANGLSGSGISLGQAIIIPSSTSIYSMNATIAQPVMANTQIVKPKTTIKRIVHPVEAETTSIYAVLPKDTLYSISRRTCTSVGDIIATNGIANPNALTPGQKLTLPSGHCLTQ